MVVFPTNVMHIDVGRDQSIGSLKYSLEHDQLIFLTMQKQASDETPTLDGLHTTGTLCRVKHVIELPGNSRKKRILIEGMQRGFLHSFSDDKVYFEGEIELFEENFDELDSELRAKVRMLKKTIEIFFSYSQSVVKEVMQTIFQTDDPYYLFNLSAFTIPFDIEKKQELLNELDLNMQYELLLEILNDEIAFMKLERDINRRVRKKIDKMQKDHYLKEQMKVIQSELSDGNEGSLEVQKLREKIQNSDMTDSIREVALKELKRISMMQEQSSEFNVGRTYLEWLIALPWQKKTKDTLSVTEAEKVLNRDHYGLEKVKERILEYIAVLQLTQSLKGPILCLVGPPGVGKTSLAQSIAKALRRKYVRIALGGVRDESEIRGHRRTYLGALPGRIISSMKKAGTVNPLFLLDEIDKISSDFRGDPFGALLEVLDPEQNHTFSDHYIEEPYDLSDVMFIATANSLTTIPAPLLDRMEVIEIPGYTELEKQQIAKRFLLPKQLKENGLQKGNLIIKDDLLLKVIQMYTREAGVRRLERALAKLCRKTAKLIVSGKRKRVTLNEKLLIEFLGQPIYHHRDKVEKSEIGVATGLAYTQYGGDVLPIEVSLVKGKGKLILTGKLGDVMKESAQTAISYVRMRAADFNLLEDFHETYDIHIHVPEGAVPKDGPSAGVTMVTAVVSALSKRPVDASIGMTGEITLRGRVLPIGGLREKTMSAHRAGLRTVIFPKDNEKDLEEIPEEIRNEINLVPVSHLDEVLKLALVEAEEK